MEYKFLDMIGTEFVIGDIVINTDNNRIQQIIDINEKHDNLIRLEANVLFMNKVPSRASYHNPTTGISLSFNRVLLGYVRDNNTCDFHNVLKLDARILDRVLLRKLIS